jgi:glucose/arabinose dehydrogenase
MTRPPRKVSTLFCALLLAACSASNEKTDAGGGGGANEAGPNDEDDSGEGSGSADGDGGGDVDAGSRMDGGSRDAGGGGEDAGRTDSGGGGTGGDSGAGTDSGPVTTTCDPSAAPTIPKLALETVVTGLDKLVYAAQPPGSTDWWLVQQIGKISIHTAGGGADTVVLDVSSEIALTMGAGDDERGLLGLAFDAEFATSGLFYVMITPTTGMANTDQVRQYKKMGATAMLVDTLLTVPASAVNHNGGTIVMGPDGLLYVGVGDGGGTCNSSKPGAPQDRAALNGKILRLDPARKAQMYAAEGNPFTENPLVLHYGLRNPFRISLDSETHDLLIGDVGQDSYEEVDFAKAGSKGLNFGWAAIEGKTMGTCAGRTLRAGDTAVDPIFVADRRRVGCSGMYCDWVSVIGGIVYRGNAIPQLKGTYVFGDYNGVRMVALKACESGTSPATPILKNKNANMPNAASFGADDFSALVAIVEDNAKEMYFVVNRNSLRKVVAAP